MQFCLVSFLMYRSYDVYGFCHSHHDSLQGDDDMLKIKVRKNEQEAHRVLHVSVPHYLKFNTCIPLLKLEQQR